MKLTIKWGHCPDEEGPSLRSYEWDVLRVGMDFGIKCRGCGHYVLLPRAKFEKAVREVLVHKED